MSSELTKGRRVLSRRDALKAIAVASSGSVASVGSEGATHPASGPAEARPPALPTHRLGKTGLPVTRLALGGGYPSYSKRLLDCAYRNGIRCFDTAYGYGNGQQEGVLGDWVNSTERRSEVFIIDKDGICSPEQFYEKVVRALERIHLDSIDLFMIHSVEDPGLPRDAAGAWGKLKDRLVRENKIRFMGFSTHADMPRRVQCLENAARSGWVDVVMVAADPLLLRTNDDLNRALDGCIRSNVGLLAMKTTRGLGKKAAERRGVPEGQARTEEMPGFDKLGLSAFGAVHYGMWSDGRFASICSAMLNIRMIEENTANARRFKPLNPEQWQRLEEGMRRLSRMTCPGCDGSCRHASGTRTDFAAIARLVAYAEEDGNRAMARELYRALPADLRSVEGGNLCAASAACPARLDFLQLLEKARKILA